MKKAKAYLVSIIISTSLLISCNGQALISNMNENDIIIANENELIDSNIENEISNSENNRKNDNSGNEVNEKNLSKNEDGNENKEIKNPIEEINLDLKPNELGKIMVLMYHGIDSEESTWVRTPENFRKDLLNLYNNGYRPISLKDFVNNNINIEQGYTPVIITFDDGNLNNFNIIGEDEKGNPILDPNCAVAILEEFNKSHPDFPLEATFFINGTNPFRQEEYIEYKLNYIVSKGMDIGNHTLGHDNFKKFNKGEYKKLQEVIGAEAFFLESLIPDYEVNTLALPFGSRPKDRELYKYLEEGEFNGKKYKNIAVLNVGWMPSVSPVDKKFNKYSIHRVRASEMNVDGVGIYDWINYFKKHPEKKYISDGNPDIITIPKKLESNLDLEKIKDKTVYIYE